ncbi:MAG: ribulose-bisphosphate carboxylase large subunit, partial [Candidatus Omnitrophica bacterium]|nr:ribulose-bisphosphate carboxylase large subunit [Candidatus Omnitrophota bacterium]
WCPKTPLLPAISGGLNPRTVAANVRRLGVDNLYLAGTGVFENPEGPKAGVEALKRAAAEALGA